MKYLLCHDCRNAWVDAEATKCRCGASPEVIDPFHGRRQLWFQASVRNRADSILTALYASHAQQRRSLLKGIRSKGNTSTRLRAYVGPAGHTFTAAR